MYIVMDDNKNLNKKSVSPIYQGETLMDTFYLIFPTEYKGYDLTEFAVTMIYITSGNIKYEEELEWDGEYYNDTYMLYSIPVDTKFTTYAGGLSLSFVFTKTEDSTEYIMRTGSTTVDILPTNAYLTSASSTSDSSSDSSTNLYTSEVEVVEF